jgi:hypothetical protein
LLCQKVPDPPGDVDFTAFEDPNSPRKTARERLAAHSVQPACAGCHKITDPVGLALENFDGIGQMRQAENGAPINASGDLDGIPYADALGLGKAMHDNPATPSCVVRRLWSYASGRPAGSTSPAYLQYLDQSFVKGGYRVPNLLKQIALSDAFFAVSKPAAQTAMNIPDSGPLASAQRQETAP